MKIALLQIQVQDSKRENLESAKAFAKEAAHVPA